MTMGESTQSSTKSQSLLARVSEEMSALEKRDWELWLVVAGCGIFVGLCLVTIMFQAAFLKHGTLRLNLEISPQLFFGFVAILILFNTYIISRRLELRRTREQIISTTIQSELVRLQSFTDPLTEVYNRRALNEMSQRYTCHAKRNKKPLTFLMVDVDRFKKVNTLFGHLTGDFVLAEVASILRGAVRGTDAVVRYGGDEFLVILADSPLDGAQVVVERVTQHLAEWNGEGHLRNFELTFSMGLAQWADGMTLDQILDEADQKMYSTKALNKNAAY